MIFFNTVKRNQKKGKEKRIDKAYFWVSPQFFSSAISFATFIRGNDEETQILRRNLVRYLVLTQTLVLRDISMQVRRRFPTYDTLTVAGNWIFDTAYFLGFISDEELTMLEEISDLYSRYWAPIEWCYLLLHEVRRKEKIAGDLLMVQCTQVKAIARGQTLEPREMD